MCVKRIGNIFYYNNFISNYESISNYRSVGEKASEPTFKMAGDRRTVDER